MLKVMVVDDMPVFIDYMTTAIPWDLHGFELIAKAKDGREALDLAIALRPDIVLTDITMPHMDGMALTRALKEVLPQVSVVLITGHTEFQYAREAIRLGAQDYLVKPFDAQELLITLLKLQQYHQKALQIQQAKLDAQDLKTHSLLRHLVLSPSLPDLTQYEGLDLAANLSRAQGFRIVCIAFPASDGHQGYVLNHWRSSVQNILEQALGEDTAHYSFTDYEDRLVVLLCYEQATNMAFYSDDMQALMHTITDKLNMPLSLGFGNAYTQVQHIRQSYQDALATLPQGGALDENTDLPTAKKHRISIEMEQYLRAHFTHADLSMAEVSKHLLINQTDLRSIFKQETGYTMTDFILKLRMEMAQDLLANSHHKLGTIAEMVGYTDQGYFSRCFKRYFGHPPKEHQKI